MNAHYTIMYKHFRRVKPTHETDTRWADITTACTHDARKYKLKILPCGGETFCIIFNTNGEKLGAGHAICCEADNFCKKIGRKISLDRALHEASLNRKDVS